MEKEPPEDGPACEYPAGACGILFPVPEFRNNSTWAVVKTVHDEKSCGLLLKDTYGDGCMWTLSVPESYPDFYKLPAAVLSRMRQAMAVNGIWMEGDARISLFIYDNDSFILYPYVMKDVHGGTVRLHIKNAAALHAAAPGDHSQWEEKKQGQIMPLYRRNEEAVFVLPAVPGRYVLYRIIRE